MVLLRPVKSDLALAGKSIATFVVDDDGAIIIGSGAGEVNTELLVVVEVLPVGEFGELMISATVKTGRLVVEIGGICRGTLGSEGGTSYWY